MTSPGGGDSDQLSPPDLPDPKDGPSQSPASETGAPSSSSSAAGEEPLLPATYHENDLRLAVGASPVLGPATGATRKHPAPAIDPRDEDDEDNEDDDDDGPSRPRRGRKAIVPVLSIVAGLAIAGLVLLGHVNSGRYLLACEADRAVPEQGRAFPPWGSRALEGAAWKPLKIAPETRCQPRETDEPLILERLYLAMILDQATGMLTAREVTRLDDAEALLDQALLLTRPPEQEPEKLASERNERHKEIERMLGDVTYWRAVAKLHDAATSLADAAKQFDSAAARRPRYVSDAAAWAAYARKLAQELRAGPQAGPVGATPSTSSPAPPASGASSLPGAPAGAPASPAPMSATERPSAPVGVELPVEPGKGSANEPPRSPSPPDAGVATGGVLL